MTSTLRAQPWTALPADPAVLEVTPDRIVRETRAALLMAKAARARR